MYASPTVINSEYSEFNLKKLRLNTRFQNIIYYCVSDLVNDTFNFLDDVADGSMVVMWNPEETGYWHQHWITRLNDKLKNKKFEFVYLTGAGPNNNISEFFDIKFNFRHLTVFDSRVVDVWNNQDGIDDPIGPVAVSVHKYKKFTFLNEEDAVHQRYVLSRLAQSGLLDQGVVSFQLTNDVDIFSKSNDLSEKHGFTPAGIDYVKDQCTNLPKLPIEVSGVLKRSTHHNTYVSVVAETFLTYSSQPFKQTFVTEKIFNSIACNQIFFIVGQPHSLKLLKDMGYQTFASIIDEGYDNIESHQERLFAVTREIVKFLKRPEDEITADYEKIIPIIEHNRDLLFKQTLKHKMQTFFNEHYA